MWTDIRRIPVQSPAQFAMVLDQFLSSHILKTSENGGCTSHSNSCYDLTVIMNSIYILAYLVWTSHISTCARFPFHATKSMDSKFLIICPRHWRLLVCFSKSISSIGIQSPTPSVPPHKARAPAITWSVASSQLSPVCRRSFSCTRGSKQVLS